MMTKMRRDLLSFPNEEKKESEGSVVLSKEEEEKRIIINPKVSEQKKKKIREFLRQCLERTNDNKYSSKQATANG